MEQEQDSQKSACPVCTILKVARGSFLVYAGLALLFLLGMMLFALSQGTFEKFWAALMGV